MQDNENLVRRAEGLIMWRKGLMAVMALGVIGVCGTMLAKHLQPGLLELDLADTLRNLGMVLVFGCIAGTAMIRGRIRRNPDLKALIEDERAAMTRYRMFFYGYFVLLAGVMVCTLLNVTGVLDTKSMLLILLMIGGITPPVLFIVTR